MKNGGQEELQRRHRRDDQRQRQGCMARTGWLGRFRFLLQRRRKIRGI
jgi:hypothetical protein